MLLRNVTCRTISLLSCSYVNIVEVLNVMCALVAMSVVLRSLVCICLCCQYIHNVKYVDIYGKKLTHKCFEKKYDQNAAQQLSRMHSFCKQYSLHAKEMCYTQAHAFVHMEITIP